MSFKSEASGKTITFLSESSLIFTRAARFSMPFSHKPKENSVGSRNWGKCHLQKFCEQFQLMWDFIDRLFCFTTCFNIICYLLSHWCWLLQSWTFGEDLFLVRLIFWCPWLYAPTCCSADEGVRAGMPLSTMAGSSVILKTFEIKSLAAKKKKP